MASSFDDDVVLLSIDTNAYFGIEGAGTRMWELLGQPTTVDAISRTIAAELDVDLETAHADALEFCRRLDSSGLIIRQS